MFLCLCCEVCAINSRQLALTNEQLELTLDKAWAVSADLTSAELTSSKLIAVSMELAVRSICGGSWKWKKLQLNVFWM